MKKQALKIEVSDSIGSVSALFIKPDKVCALFVFAHGAGAGMEHPFMEKVAAVLGDRNIATLRYQFPYMEEGKKRPDPPGIAIKTVESAVNKAKEVAGNIPVFAGGKSFGGRMTSQAAAEGKIEVDGIIFLGFPLHAPGKPSNDRADHLFKINCTMLFLQGTRDSLAKLEYLEPVIKKLGSKAKLKILEGGDHSFGTRKSDNISEEEVFEWIADSIDGLML